MKHRDGRYANNAAIVFRKQSLRKFEINLKFEKIKISRSFPAPSYIKNRKVKCIELSTTLSQEEKKKEQTSGQAAVSSSD